MLNSLANTGAANGTTASSKSTQTDAAASQDRFLKLLVAQLNNQDPMNPMDNAQMTSQMAQINTVSGIQQLNATIKSMQAMQGASMIGREVMTAGNTLAINAGVAKGAVDLTSDADRVTVQIMSPGGQVIDTLNLGKLPAGRTNFNWDASKYTGTDAPTFKVSATQGTSAVTATGLTRNTVESVSTDTTGMTLTLKGGSTVKYDAIKVIL
jgi:flagellar basal-body rod modification protein FlgD